MSAMIGIDWHILLLIISLLMAARQSTEVQESMPMLNGGYPVLVDQQLLVTELT